VVWLPGTAPTDSHVVIGGYAGGRLIEALGLRILQGRGFVPDDARPLQPRVAVVNRPFAEEYLDGAVVGQILRVAPYEQGRSAHADSVEVQIVGVVEPAHYPSYGRGRPVPALYVPVPLRQDAALTLYVRTRDGAETVAPALRAAIQQVDARVPVQRLQTLTEFNETERAPATMLGQAAFLLGVVALVLAAWGLYAVVSFLVWTRSREIAIRLALGARREGMLAMVLRQAMTMTAVGALIGGAAAYAIGRVIQAEMHAIPGTDLVALAQAIGWLVLATLAAAVVPSLRAARVNPAVLLKEQ
jgi:hypothetical protein